MPRSRRALQPPHATYLLRWPVTGVFIVKTETQETQRNCSPNEKKLFYRSCLSGEEGLGPRGRTPARAATRKLEQFSSTTVLETATATDCRYLDYNSNPAKLGAPFVRGQGTNLNLAPVFASACQSLLTGERSAVGGSGQQAGGGARASELRECVRTASGGRRAARASCRRVPGGQRAGLGVEGVEGGESRSGTGAGGAGAGKAGKALLGHAGSSVLWSARTCR